MSALYALLFLFLASHATCLVGVLPSPTNIDKLSFILSGNIRGQLLGFRNGTACTSSSYLDQPASCIGGLQRLDAFVRRASAQPTTSTPRGFGVIVDGGNNLFGYASYWALRGNASSSIMGKIPYSILSLGPEDLRGSDAANSLRNYFKSADAGSLLVLSNWNNEAQSQPPSPPLIPDASSRFVSSAIIYNSTTRAVGLISVTASDLVVPELKAAGLSADGFNGIASSAFKYAEGAIRQQVAELENAIARADAPRTPLSIILVSSDSQAANTYYAASVLDIDAVLETTPDGLRNSDGSPFTVLSGSGKLVPIVSSHADGLTVATLDLNLPPPAVPSSSSSSSSLGSSNGGGGGEEPSITFNSSLTWLDAALSAHVTPDAERTVMGFADQLERRAALPLASTSAALVNYGDCLGTACNVAQFVLGAHAWYWREACGGCVAGLEHGAAFGRGAWGLNGPLSENDVKSLYPFGLRFVTVNITGDQLWRLLESTADLHVRFKSGVLHGANLRYTYNPLSNLGPADSRLLAVDIQTNGIFKPLAFHLTYRVSMSSLVFQAATLTSSSSSSSSPPVRHEPGAPAPPALPSFSNLFQTSTASVLLGDYVASALMSSISVQGPRPVAVASAGLLNATCGQLRELHSGQHPDLCNIVLSTRIIDDTKVCNTNADFCALGRKKNGPLAIFGASLNSTLPCDTCSGAGTCANNVCTCRVLGMKGEFTGVPVVSGPLCDQVLGQMNELLPPMVVLSYVSSALVYAGAAVLIALTIHFRAHSLIKRASPLFTCVFLSASIVGATASFIESLDCIAWMWLVSVATTLMFATLAGQLSRLEHIFNSKLLQKSAFTDFDVLQRIAFVLAIDIGLLIILTISNNVQQEYVLVDIGANGIPSSYTYVCNLTAIYYYLLVPFHLITAVDLFRICFSIRKINKDYNDARPIMLSLYAWVTVAAVIFTIMVAFPPSPGTGRLAVIVAYNFHTLVMICAIFAPKFASLYEAELQQKPPKSGLSTIRRVSMVPAVLERGNSIISDFESAGTEDDLIDFAFDSLSIKQAVSLLQDSKGRELRRLGKSLGQHGLADAPDAADDFLNSALSEWTSRRTSAIDTAVVTRTEKGRRLSQAL
jgi:2',3'-cyclic-nucleotide 2'-phosphodiesterase (5'-nucleotidase family)